MAPTPSLLASSIVDQIPILLACLRKYEEQNNNLDLRCVNMEQEVTLTRKSIEDEKMKQRRIRSRIAEVDATDFEYRQEKRLIVDEEFCRSVNPRVEWFAIGPGKSPSSPLRKELDSNSSIVSIGTKRKARLFTNEEATLIVDRNLLADGVSKPMESS